MANKVHIHDLNQEVHDGSKEFKVRQKLRHKAALSNGSDRALSSISGSSVRIVIARHIRGLWPWGSTVG